MITFTIKLKSINEVKEFVRIVNDYPYEVDLTSGRYVVDAKSIMGIFSLDLSQPMDVTVHQDESEELIDKLRNFML